MSTRIGINKINKDIIGHNSVYIVCERQDGTFIGLRTMQLVSRIIKKDIFRHLTPILCNTLMQECLLKTGLSQSTYRPDLDIPTLRLQ